MSDKMKFEPSYIRNIECSPEELENKLKKFQGAIASRMALVMFEFSGDSYNSNRFGESIEGLVFEKIKNSLVSKNIFLDWLNNVDKDLKDSHLEGQYGEISYHSLNCLIRKVQKETVSI